MDKTASKSQHIGNKIVKAPTRTGMSIYMQSQLLNFRESKAKAIQKNINTNFALKSNN